MQPQVFAVHFSLPLHTPQDSVLPQPSSMVPQFAPSSVQVFGEQPHTFAMPPPEHVFGAVQPPQSITALQPSETVPQFAPKAEHVAGLQTVVPHW